MADGWLFRLSSTLGARQSAPSWPTAAAGPAGPDQPRGPALRVVAAERVEPIDPLLERDRSSG